MADNVEITAGLGTIIATDDIGGNHYQKIKIFDATADSTVGVTADTTYGLASDVKRMVEPAIVTGSGNLTGSSQSVALTLNGQANATFQFTGTWTATITFEASNDNSNWTTIYAYRAGDDVIGQTVVNSTNNDIYRCTVAGFGYVRARCSAYTSGTIVVTAIATSKTSGVFLNFALPSGNNNIGDVDVLTVPAPLSTTGNGTAATAHRVTIASDSTGVIAVTDNSGSLTIDGTVTTVGDVAHDGVDSGNPQKVGGKARATPSTATMVADGDRSDFVTDTDALHIIKPYTSYGDILSERVTDTGGTSTAFSTFGATASTRNYVTTIVLHNSSSTNGYVDFRDGTAGTILFTLPVPAQGGAICNFPVPLRQPTANTALAYDVSAALSTVFISIVGFKSKV